MGHSCQLAAWLKNSCLLKCCWQTFYSLLVQMLLNTLFHVAIVMLNGWLTEGCWQVSTQAFSTHTRPILEQTWSIHYSFLCNSFCQPQCFMSVRADVHLLSGLSHIHKRQTHSHILVFGGFFQSTYDDSLGENNYIRLVF